MIAHRLTTIASADNLLYFKSRSHLVSAEKGSSEYNEIFEKLKCIQYAKGVENDEEDVEEDDEGEDFDDENEQDEIIEEEREDSDDEPASQSVQKKTNDGDEVNEEFQRCNTDGNLPRKQDVEKQQEILPNFAPNAS